ncbi:UxaA family hydrolase [Sagittula salina]|nr:altronate dehydratase family protein [Sagittula salina]
MPDTRPSGPVIHLDPADNVAVARRDIAARERIGEVTALQPIPAGHKIALCPIARGDPVLKYATVIGFAGADCPAGTWMHAHNVLMDAVQKDWRIGQDYRAPDLLPSGQRARFMGYARPDGRVGTRNMLGVFITVNCAATVARRIAAGFEDRSDYGNVDGVIPFIHQQGCGMEATGEAMDLLHRTLAGYIRHPNIAGALVVSLGCERNNLDRFFADTALEAGTMLHTIRMQSVGGTAAAIEEGRRLIREMLPEANRTARTPQSAEHITVGLQCGGSDGFSGLSANPALGRAVDTLTRHGGTAILSEFPELYGIEHTLTARARDEATARKFIERINWWLDHTDGRDVQMQGIVGPGNQQGGLANVIEKALGGAKKGGSTGIQAVYKYAEPVTEKGLVLMDTPGYDPVAATGQIAGGATLIAFTTGRGSCFGSYPAPTIKLASNSMVYQNMGADMDIDCGTIIDGTATLDGMGEEIFRHILATASGERTKSEVAGVGAEEFAPWPIGVTG